MREREYQREFGPVYVEEMTRKEFIGEVQCIIADVLYFEESGIYEDTDLSVWVEYKDGSTFSFNDSCGMMGRFRKTNIVFGRISNPCTYQVFGKYVITDECLCEMA